jgi:hypothetical protein
MAFTLAFTIVFIVIFLVNNGLMGAGEDAKTTFYHIFVEKRWSDSVTKLSTFLVTFLPPKMARKMVIKV